MEGGREEGREGGREREGEGEGRVDGRKEWRRKGGRRKGGSDRYVYWTYTMQHPSLTPSPHHSLPAPLPFSSLTSIHIAQQ